jgi:hypothetical protein
MLTTTTPQTLIDDVLALTNEDGYSLVTNAQLCAWINAELTAAWSWIPRSNRDIITKSTSQFSMTSATISMTASAPALALTDFLHPRGVDVLVGTDEWQPIRKWNFSTRNQIYSMCYRFIGDVLYIYPTDQYSTYPFRVWYIHMAPAVSSSALSTAFSLPLGLDEYIKQGVAAKLRMRLDDQAAEHRQLQAEARQNVQALLRTAKGDQGIIADVSEDGAVY